MTNKNKHEDDVIDLLVEDAEEVETLIEDCFALSDKKPEKTIARKTSRVKKTVAKAKEGPKKIETRLPIRLLVEDDSTKLRNLNLFSEFPLAALTVENVRKRYVIRQQVAGKYTQDVTITLLPPTQGFDNEGSTGLPTINDTDIIKFCISMLQRKRQEDKIELTEDMRTVTFTYRDFLEFTGAEAGGSNLIEMKNALMRLKGTVIEITSEWLDEIPEELNKSLNIYNSGQFSFIDDFQISADAMPGKAKSNSRVIVSLTLSRMVWRTFMNPKNLIIYNRFFFKLSAFKKSLYEKVVKSMGNKEFFRIRLIKLASRMGAIEGDLLDELAEEDTIDGGFSLEQTIARQREVDRKINEALKYFKRLLREAIADDDLLDFKIALEKGSKTNGHEMVVFYRRDFKHRMSNVQNARTGERLTQLEYVLHSQKLLNWWQRDLDHSQQMQLKLTKNKRWMARHEYDLEALRIGDGDISKRWRRGQKSRYELLSYIRDIEKGKFTELTDIYESFQDDDDV